MSATATRLPRTLRRSLLFSGVSFGLMLGVRAWEQWVGPLPGDRYAIYHYYPGDPDLPRGIVDGYVELAKPWVAVVTLLVGLAVLRWRVGPRAAVGLLLAELTVPLNFVLKQAFGPTPVWTDFHNGGINYPSGHTSYVTAVFGYLAWIGLRRRQPALVTPCLIIIVGMGPERVLSGTHVPSDVIGGYLLGLACVVPVCAWVGGDAVVGSG